MGVGEVGGGMWMLGIEDCRVNSEMAEWLRNDEWNGAKVDGGWRHSAENGRVRQMAIASKLRPSAVSIKHCAVFQGIGLV